VNSKGLSFIFLIILFTIVLSIAIVATSLIPNMSNSSNGKKQCKSSPTEPNIVEPIDIDESNCDFYVYPNGIVINELDSSTCRRVSKYIIIDKNNVYKQQYDPGSSDYNTYTIVEQADAASFERLRNGYYKDTNYLFYDIGENLSIINNIDISSVKILSTNYLKDKGGVYYKDSRNSDKLVKLENFDLESFAVIQNKENHEVYFKDKNGVYYIEKRVGVIKKTDSKIYNADINTFEVLNEYFMAKDKNNVYYEGKSVNVEDPNSFVKIGRYFKDNNSVYSISGGNFVKHEEIDGCSYELIKYDNKYDWKGYSKDKSHVYYRNKIIEGADPETFVVTDNKVFDKNSEYQGIYTK